MGCAPSISLDHSTLLATCLCDSPVSFSPLRPLMLSLELFPSRLWDDIRPSDEELMLCSALGCALTLRMCSFASDDPSCASFSAIPCAHAGGRTCVSSVPYEHGCPATMATAHPSKSFLQCSEAQRHMPTDVRARLLAPLPQKTSSPTETVILPNILNATPPFAFLQFAYLAHHTCAVIPQRAAHGHPRVA